MAKTAVSGVRGVEAWYEYTSGVKETLKTGMRVISDPEDERWDDELQKPPFKAGARGYLIVADVTRIDGQIVQMHKQIIGAPAHQNKAREFLREFKRLQEAGSATPWDQERHHRDEKERKEREAREGAKQTNEMLRSLLVAAAEAGDPA